MRLFLRRKKASHLFIGFMRDGLSTYYLKYRIFRLFFSFITTLQCQSETTFKYLQLSYAVITIQHATNVGTRSEAANSAPLTYCTLQTMQRTACFKNKTKIEIADISKAFTRGLPSVVEAFCMVSDNRKTDSNEAAAVAVQRRLTKLKDLTR